MLRFDFMGTSTATTFLLHGNEQLWLEMTRELRFGTAICMHVYEQIVCGPGDARPSNHWAL